MHYFIYFFSMNCARMWTIAEGTVSSKACAPGVDRTCAAVPGQLLLRCNKQAQPAAAVSPTETDSAETVITACCINTSISCCWRLKRRRATQTGVRLVFRGQWRNYWWKGRLGYSFTALQRFQWEGRLELSVRLLGFIILCSLSFFSCLLFPSFHVHFLSFHVHFPSFH